MAQVFERGIKGKPRATRKPRMWMLMYDHRAIVTFSVFTTLAIAKRWFENFVAPTGVKDVVWERTDVGEYTAKTEFGYTMNIVAMEIEE
jgi:hypothetical protein